MAYTKYNDPWSDSDLRSAEAMDHIESQWTSIKALIDVHNHDTRYYTKALTDIAFFSTTNYSDCDADLLDGNHLSVIVQEIMPIGAIMAWYQGTIPAGWYVCDGAAHNGYTTPNLVERFVIGAGGTYNPGDTAGPGSWNGTFTPTASITIGDHQLTTDELPVHAHSYTETRNSLSVHMATSGGMYPMVFVESTTSIQNQAVGGGSHNHTPGSSITLNAVDTRPSLYAVYFIMKCE
jgi:hypothetical protein